MNFNRNIEEPSINPKQDAMDSLSSNSKALYESSQFPSPRKEEGPINEIKFNLDRSILENRAKSQLSSLQNVKNTNLRS